MEMTHTRTNGRPTKLTPELQRQIVGLIAAGNYPDVAAAACGVSKATFYEWIQRGLGEHPTRGPTRALAEFAAAIEQAIAKAEVRLVMKAAEYTDGTRKGVRKPKVKSRVTYPQVLTMQWMLSRRFPERWAHRPPPPIVEVDEPDEQRPQHTIIVRLSRPEPGDPDYEGPAELAQAGGALEAEVRHDIARGARVPPSFVGRNGRVKAE